MGSVSLPVGFRENAGGAWQGRFYRPPLPKYLFTTEWVPFARHLLY